MIVSHVVNLLLIQRQAVIIISPRTLLVLPSQTKEYNRSHCTTKQEERPAGAISSRVFRSFGGDEDIRSHDAIKIAESNLGTRGHRSLVVTTLTIGQPCNANRLNNVSSGADKVDGQVTDANSHFVPLEEDHMSIESENDT